ncbi:MAG: tetratricopeptide repeat protein [Chloroflexales bacterium]|nr:tetratricopeptide repeat protein [Chloroflexales bacterium]
MDEALGDLRGLRCVICLDNLGWAEQSRELLRLIEGLRDLARAGEALIMLTALEPPLVAGSWPILALGGLDPASGASLLGGYPGAPPGDDRARLARRAGGNPQLLHLLGSYLGRQGGDRPTEVLWPDRSGGAAQALVSLIVGGLSARELELLQAVAVLLEAGGTCGAIESLLQRTDLRVALAELEARGLLSADPGPWGPSYTVVATLHPTLYKALDRQRRRTLHRRAASYYEFDEPDLPRVVQHLQRAGDHVRAARIAARVEHGLIRGIPYENLGTAQAQLVLAQLQTDKLAPEQRASLYWLRGDVALRLGDGRRAEMLLLKAMSMIGAEQGVTCAYRCTTLARLYAYLGNYSAAEEWCERGLAALGPVTGPSPAIARLALIRSELLFRLRMYEAAVAACTMGLETLPPDLAARDLELALRHRLATIHGDQGLYVQAIGELEALLPAARSFADPALLAAILNNLGSYCQDAGRIEAARAYHAASLPIKERLGDAGGQAVSLLNLGRLHLAEGDPRVALVWLHEALRRSEQYGFLAWQGSTLVCIAQAYLELHELDQALETSVRARRTFTQLGDPVGAAHSYCLCGDVALARGEAAMALAYGRQALAHAREGESLALIACALRVLGEAELARGQLDQALAYLDEAAAVEDHVRDPYDLALIRSAQARLEEARGRRARALAYAEEALDLARAQHIPAVAAAMEALIARQA